MTAPSKKGGKKAKEVIRQTYDNTTPKGHKKDVDQPMLDSYNPAQCEAAWDAWWQAQGYYKPEHNSQKPPFVMVIPPPNVTGELHLGHALTVAVEDALTRFKRMKGFNTLWLPGVDHAGIATQSVVERRLQKDKGLSRHDLGREKFVEETWKWKEDYGGRIFNQLRLLGASVDWSREVFTMDPKMSVAVTEAFVRMYESGKVYRATRLVNWSCELTTAIADCEVDKIELTGPTKLSVPGYERKIEFGVMHNFGYKFVDQEKFGADTQIVVGTTRLETMLGDVAVAVHPENPKYQKFIGAELRHPFLPERKVVVIADTMADPEKGTGAVKITPAHDPNDFACGERHQLPKITILNEKGLINANGGAYEGMPRYNARYKLIDDLKAIGQYHGSSPNPQALGLCSRSKDVIEPALRPQWWVDCAEMAKRSTDAVRNGDLKIVPSSGERTFFQWLDNIRPWCISRQLWWGHRIPAWLVKIDGKEVDSASIDSWIVARSPEEAQSKAAAKFPDQKFSLEQDPDVLDTWFSSGLFPFATMGWPNQDSLDLKDFFPGALLETGGDIIFFWVARMVMMSLELTDQLPFKEVFLHPMVRDKNGGKMSKSKGNVINPLDMIGGCDLQKLLDDLTRGNIADKEVKKYTKEKKADFPDGLPQCGADALRFGLLTYCAQGRQINLDVQRVVGYRQFCNKLWNATKFSMAKFPSKDFLPETDAKVLFDKGTFADRWVLSCLDRSISTVNKAMDQYNFAEATQAAYDFWLKEFCGIYLELLKPVIPYDIDLSQESPEAKERRLTACSVLALCLSEGLKLLHPFMPFVSEELWQRLPRKDKQESDTIMLQSFPEPLGLLTSSLDADMELIMLVVSKCRSARMSMNLGNKARPQTFATTTSAELLSNIAGFATEIETLAGLSELITCDSGDARLEGTAHTVVNHGINVYTVVKGLIDIPAELKKLDKQIGKKRKFVESLEKKVTNPKYLERTPQNVQDKDQAKLEAQKTELAGIIASIDKLKLMQEQE